MQSFKRFMALSIMGLATALPCGIAAGQSDPPLAGKKQQPKPDQPENRGDRGEGEGRRRQRGGPGGGFDSQGMVDRLTEELNLTEEQQKTVKEILDKRMAAMRNSDNLKPEDREKVRELREQMRDAREAGDREKMQELGEQMRAITGDPREAFEKSREEMRQQIRGVLTPDQQKKYDAMPQQMMGARRRGGPVAPRVLREAVMRLELGTDQKGRIEAIFEKVKDAEKNLQRDDRQSRAELNRKLREDVAAVLTPEQTQQLERNLQRAEGRGQRGQGREGRPGRDGRGQPGQDLRGGDRDDKGA